MSSFILRLRGDYGPKGSFYEATVDDVHLSYALMLRWDGNVAEFSRIPVGVYSLGKHHSPHLHACFQVKDVPGRDEILCHPGCFVGDTRQGLKTDSLGCILPVTTVRMGEHQLIGCSSVLAFTKWLSLFNSGTVDSLEVK